MAVEILPATGGELHGLDVRTQTVIIPGEREQITRTESGPTALIEVRRDYWRLQSQIDASVRSIVVEDGNGRATLTVSFASAVSTSDIQQNEKYGTQELRGYDQIKDIETAPYFKTLTNEQCFVVRRAFEDGQLTATGSWSDLQISLFGHLQHGFTSFVETAYEFTQTFQVSSTKALKVAAENPNTVQDLPDLSPTMKKLIDALPEGEWLKKPTQVLNAGRNGWTVIQTFLWADQWSIIFGGSFTGL
jgi:hypothetical protein